MLKIKQYPTGPLSVNTYLVCDDASKECVIIDLGGEIDKIYNDINEFGGDLKYILNSLFHLTLNSHFYYYMLIIYNLYIFFKYPILILHLNINYINLYLLILIMFYV